MENKTQRLIQGRFGCLIEQLGTLLFSILLALIVWLIAINEIDPLQQGEYPQPLPLQVEGLADGLTSRQELDKIAVRISLRAPASVWSTLKEDSLFAYVDLSELGQGSHQRPVMLRVVPQNIQITDLQPSVIEIDLEPISVREVPIHVEIMDSSAFGYEWDTPIFKPITAKVEGPESLVNAVNRLEAPVYLHSAKNQVERIQLLTPYNETNQEVSNIRVEPPTIQITVPVRRMPGRKEVVVRPKLAGELDKGYRLSAIAVNPSTVILSGATEQLSDVPGFIETEPLSLTNATAEIQKQVALVVPEGTESMDGSSVSVTASITPIKGGITVERKPTLHNLQDGLHARIELDTVDVILSGPIVQLEYLDTDDVRVILDLSGLLSGSHIVKPKLELPEGISQVSILPETIEVVIERLIAPESPLDTPDS